MGRDREVRLSYEAACPRCPDGPHRFDLVATLSRGTILFGGGGEPKATATGTATLTCPETGAPFEVAVGVPAHDDERITAVRVADAGPATTTPTQPSPTTAPTGATPEPAPDDWRAEDLADWRKASGDLARDAAAKLLGAGTAAVGGYFAILKYVGGEEVEGWRRVVAALPAVGYLTVCVLAAVALRPVLLRVYGPDDFERLRESRLVRLNRLLAAAVVTFVAATALAAVAFVLVWP